MARTRTELVNRVLKRLQAVAIGQSPSEEDRAAVDDELDGIFDSLAGRDIVTVPDPDAIDDAHFEPLSAIVADELSEDFGITGDLALRIAAKAGRAEQRLKRINRPSAAHKTLKIEKFWG